MMHCIDRYKAERAPYCGCEIEAANARTLRTGSWRGFSQNPRAHMSSIVRGRDAPTGRRESWAVIGVPTAN
jgi:hypothetical protein